MPRAYRGVSVVIADDHAPVRRGLRGLLQDGGMQVVGEAEDGQEAVRLCDQLRPGIVLLDISMPVLNGFEAAREIANRFPDTKIIFVTGHTLKEYVDEALRVGGLGIVSKNHAAEGLLAAVEAILEGKKYINSTPEPEVPPK